MLKLNEVLKASKLGGGAPDYWTELFARRVAGGWTVSTITGTLPLTFRSNGTALINYRIYGTAVGAGVQTENLLDISLFNGKYVRVFSGDLIWDINNQSVVINQTSTSRYPQSYITDSNGQALQLQEGETYSIKIDKQNIPEGGNIYVILRAMSSGTMQTYDTIVNQKIITISSGWNNWEWLLVVEGKNITYDNCTVRIDVRKSNDIPATYMPYGYQIPITVSQQGQTDKNYDIYIGDSPLTSGDYIDYESGKIVRNGTSQDPPLPFPELETFKGTNTLDSTETLGEVTIKGQIKPQS